jgi:hypothetical protein
LLKPAVSIAAGATSEAGVLVLSPGVTTGSSHPLLSRTSLLAGGLIPLPSTPQPPLDDA